MGTAIERQQLVNTMFPDGIPALWCPTLTHFLASGQFDESRILRHLEVIAPDARGVLVPGSTGEGWDMEDDEVRRLLTVVLDAAGRLGIQVLIGVLRQDIDAMLQVIQETTRWLSERSGQPEGADCLRTANVAGFTVCPPRGSDLTQDQIHSALSTVLDLGYPTALYQLPQVTENEMVPDTVARLADRYSNFYLFKDTSGNDRVATANRELQGVFLVRGAEGQYDQWTRDAGGPYDGFLLSTANCFARQLAEVLRYVANQQLEQASSLSQRISSVVTACFQCVSDFPAANPFTNANKILDHVMAYGTRWHVAPPPFLRGRRQLPAEFVKSAFDALKAQDLLPERGYLE